MVDVPLMAALIRALPPQAGLLLVGDADQLPSVGPGQVLADIINAGVVPTARLTEVFRQAAQSRIVVNADPINRGQMPELSQSKEGSDFYLAEADEPDEAARKIPEIVCRRIPAQFGVDPIREVQVLCPMNRGRLGARSLNLDLQAALNGDQSKLAVVRFGCSFRSGDKVMQTINDYDKDVFNGDLGFVHAVDLEAQELVIDFDGRLVSYDFGELDEIVPAYAITIHKAQGSEYPAVVIPLSTQHYRCTRLHTQRRAGAAGRLGDQGDLRAGPSDLLSAFILDRAQISNHGNDPQQDPGRHQASRTRRSRRRSGEAAVDPMTGAIVPPPKPGHDEDVGWFLDYFSSGELKRYLARGASQPVRDVLTVAAISIGVSVLSIFYVLLRISSLSTDPGATISLIVVTAGLALAIFAFHLMRLGPARRLAAGEVPADIVRAHLGQAVEALRRGTLTPAGRSQCRGRQLVGCSG